MNGKAVVWLCMAAIVVSASALTAQAAPYEGVLVGTNVYVRSGPGGQGAYPCAKLSTPAKVTVVDKLDDWLKVLPPPGCFSVVSKQYVTVDAATNVGTVNGDNVWVRAAGVLRTTNFFTLQLRLNKGDRVNVLGSAGEYYKVECPTGAYFWISAKFVRSAGVVSVTPTTQRVSVDVTTRRAPTSRAVITVVPPPPPKAASGGLEAFKAAEKLLLQECTKGIEARNFDPLLAKYKAVPVGGDNAYLKPYVEARIAFLQAAIERKVDLQAVKKLVADVGAREEALKVEQAKRQSESPTTRPVTHYVTQGVLLASEVFPGGVGTPKRYIVRDRHTFFINAYVQCTTGAVDFTPHVGKHVGIMGKTQFDKNLGLDIVEATDVKVLSDKVSFPQPPKPIIQPLPKLAPVPKPTTKPAPVVTPMPLVTPHVTPEPTTKPAPIIKPAPKPTTQPAPIIKPVPVIVPEPTTQPAPIIKPVPIIVPEPTTQPAPIIKAVPVIVPEPATQLVPIIKPAPVVVPVPKPTTQLVPIIKPVPVVVPVPEPTTKPAPVVLPKPVVKPATQRGTTVTPVVRFGRPKPTTQPTTKPTTKPAPTTQPAPEPKVVPAPTTRPVKPIVEEEYD